MTDRLTPTGRVFAEHVLPAATGSQSDRFVFVQCDETARREAEADDDRNRAPAPMKMVETVTMNYTDAPPPPAPDRERFLEGQNDRFAKSLEAAISENATLTLRAEAAEARVKQLEAFMSKEVVPQLRAALAQGGNDRLRDDNATARAADQMPGLTKLLGGGK